MWIFVLACSADKDVQEEVDTEDTAQEVITEELDCTDGIDNDSDGLLDCEDGDCAEDSVCLEDCTDGIDNDNNGLTDRLDPYCAVEVQVTGGMMTWREGSYLRSTTARTGVDIDYWSVSIQDVSGLIWYQGQTCSWTVDQVAFGNRSGHALYYSSPIYGNMYNAPARTNLQISPACASLDTQTVFPQDMWKGGTDHFFGGGWYYYTGQAFPWYRGSTVLSTRSTAGQIYNGHFRKWSARTWDVMLGTGAMLYPLH